MEYWPPVQRAYGSERSMVKFVLNAKERKQNPFKPNFPLFHHSNIPIKPNFPLLYHFNIPIENETNQCLFGLKIIFPILFFLKRFDQLY
jgi:hypothetical protein